MTAPRATKEQFFTVQEVAAHLRVAPMTIYRLIHAGELRSVRVGRSFRVPHQALRAYINREPVE